MNFDNIKKQAEEMKQEMKSEKTQERHVLITKYNYLYTMTPTLFEVIYKNEMDCSAILDSLIESAKKKKTQYDADVEVGEKLANIYIHPNIKK